MSDLHEVIDGLFQKYLGVTNPIVSLQLDEVTTLNLDRDDRELTIALTIDGKRTVLGHYHVYERCFYYNGDTRALEQVIALMEHAHSTHNLRGMIYGE